MIDGALIGMTALTLALAALAWWRGGAALVGEGVVTGGGMLLRFGLLIAVSFVAAGLAQALVPQEWIQRAVGDAAGVRGIAIAAVAGALTPSGPFVAMPLAAALARTGAGTGALVAYVTGWSLLAMHRFLAWEIPILGLRFALLRWGLCLVLPILAGLAARALTRS
ncbi:MAG: permease [Myxococcota bacterium]|nr:permease [Myxococcota bacterium]